MKSLEEIWKKLTKTGYHLENVCVVNSKNRIDCGNCIIYEKFVAKYGLGCGRDEKKIIEKIKLEIRKERLKKLLS